MKKRILMAGVAALVLLFVTGLTGCPEDAFTWKFVNRSSKEVTVNCKDLTPSSFKVPVGETKTATSSLGVIVIQVTPGNTFEVEEGNYTFTFRDK
jgi:hypothetical protein